jgi:glycosyltransferase involved in cell wall biosynthesis
MVNYTMPTGEDRDGGLAEKEAARSEAVPEPRVLSIAEMTAPCLRMDVELSRAAPKIPPQVGPFGAKCVWLLVFLHTEAIGSLILELPPEGLTSEQLANGISKELATTITSRSDANENSASGLAPFLRTRLGVLRNAPEITIIVCTHERPQRLKACLESLLAQDYPEFSILVVDNCPTTERSKAVVDEISSPMIRYTVEPRQGACHAKNRALQMVGDGIVASIDDDEIADQHWLAELARGFHEHPEADAVAGVMVPEELETDAQVWFEQYGGFNKHRGFTPAIFSPATARVQSPLYPLPPFASGGNVAFRTGSLARIGGFDIALGPGTPSMASEDTRVFTDILLAGGTVVYQPTAVTRHFHRRSVEELKQQMLGYSVGLTAFYTSLVINYPRQLPGLLRLVPKMCRDLFGRDSLRSGTLPPDFPVELLKAKRRGMVIGPISYIRARRNSTPRAAKLR